MEPESLARLFHDQYERLAPDHGYSTRFDTRQFDPDSPNGRLMVATCRAIIGHIHPQPTLTDEERGAVGVALQCVESARCQKHPEELAATVTLIRAEATLRKLLERLG